MKPYLKSIALLAVMLLTSTATKAQNATDTVSLVVSGQGATLEEARINALRSAIEQAYGVFISTKTELLNDSLVKDEVVSIANGNIRNYTILSETDINESTHVSTIRATVSISKLTDFCKAKGISAELSGSLFAANIKLQKLNEQAEISAIKNLCAVSKDILRQSFDYEIKVLGEPTNSKDYNDKSIPDRWEIPLGLNIYKNKNFDLFVDYFYKNLPQIGMNSGEILNYLKLKKSFHQIALFDGSKVPNYTLNMPFSCIFSFPINKFDYDYYLLKELDPDTAHKYNLYDNYKFIKLSSDNPKSIINTCNKLSTLSKSVFSVGKPLGYSLVRVYTTTKKVENTAKTIFLRTQESRDLILTLVNEIENIFQEAKLYYNCDTGRVAISKINSALLNNSMYNFRCAPVSNDNTLFFFNIINKGIYKYDNIVPKQLYASDFTPKLFSEWEYLDKYHIDPIIPNKNWDSIAPFTQNCNLISLSQLNTIKKEKTDEEMREEKYIRNEAYFNLLFPNFILYLNQISSYKGKSPEFTSTPLQFKLIGDHNNRIVQSTFSIGVKTETLSKIQGFTISK